MGYDWKLDQIHTGNVGSALPYTSRGETRLEPAPSNAGYISSSAAFMKYEIRVPHGDTSKYEETVVILEPMTNYDDTGHSRESSLFRVSREEGHSRLSKLYEKARSLFNKHQAQFSSSEKKKLKESLDISKSYLDKVKGAIDYWHGHSSMWPIDQRFDDFAYGACDSFADAGKQVEIQHPKYPEITIPVICPDAEDQADHDRDRSTAETLLDTVAGRVRYVERAVWPREVLALNKAAAAQASTGPVKFNKVSMKGGGTPPPIKVVTISSETIDPPGTGESSKRKKKKSALPLVAALGIGALLIARK